MIVSLMMPDFITNKVYLEWLYSIDSTKVQFHPQVKSCHQEILQTQFEKTMNARFIKLNLKSLIILGFQNGVG